MKSKSKKIIDQILETLPLGQISITKYLLDEHQASPDSLLMSKIVFCATKNLIEDQEYKTSYLFLIRFCKK